MRTIYLHVGYHKTATTFLQQSIYPKLKNVNYIKQKHIIKQLTRLRLKKLSDLKIENLRDYFNSFNNRQPMLISYEGLSGSPFAPEKVKTQTSILKDLRRIFPASDYDVYVIVGIRAQMDLLTSLYVQHVHQGGVMDPKHYLRYCKRNGSINNYFYPAYLQQIEKMFGPDHLYLMVYEAFKKHQTAELQRLLNFMGEDEIPSYGGSNDMRKANKSYGTMQVATARRLNRFFKSPIHPEGRLALFKVSHRNKLPTRFLLQNKLSYTLHYKKYDLPEHLRQTLREKYADSNRQLADQYHLLLPDRYF